MNNQNQTIYCGSGKQIRPDLIELVIETEQLKDYIKESRSGKLYVVCELWKRKDAGKYGETHSIKVKTYEHNNGKDNR